MNHFPVKLSSQGPKLSRLVYGAWRLSDDPEGTSPTRILAKIDTCLELGITTFDHADIYGGYTCEELFGAALATRSSLRQHMQLVSKCGIKLLHSARPAHRFKHYDTSLAHIVGSAEQSLKALRTDFIDLLLIHRPDPLADPHEVAEAFSRLHAAGKVRHFGVSNFTPGQFRALQSNLPLKLVTNQVEFSVLHTDPLDDGTLDQCLEYEITPMAWSPFAGGKLYTDNSERTVRVRQTLNDVAKQLGAPSIDSVALAWLLRHPTKVVPVLGSNSLPRIRAARSALDLEIDRQMWFAIWQATMGHEVP